jgi:integrase/recombinase XerD
MMRLYDCSGRRKYLTPDEREQFLQAAEDAPHPVRTFCATLVHTGCRLSEALALTATRVDLAAGVVVLESLKKRRKGIYRPVPVPPAFLDTLVAVHDLSALGNTRLWAWSRSTAWRRVKEVMEAAAIRGLCATPKGLRHGFGIKAVSCRVPLNLIQKWLGHAQLATTAIYTDAVGAEEKNIAERMWDDKAH